MDDDAGGGVPVMAASGLRMLWLSDHLLVSEQGHHVSYNGFIADAARRAGMGVRVLCAEGCSAEVPGGFRMDGIFRKDWRSAPAPWISRSRRALDMLELFARRRFLADLRRGVRFNDINSDDIIFAEMLAPRNLAGWLAWLTEAPPGREPFLVLHLGYAAERFGADWEIPIHLGSLRKSGKISRTRFVTDSIDLQSKYEKILGEPVAILPVVISRRAGDSYKVPQRPPLFSCLGNARREKGFAEILSAVDLINGSDEGAEVRFLLQVSDPDAPSAEALKKFRSSGAGNVRLITSPLSDNDYLAALKETDVLLAPYHVDKYHDRTSGLFCEAMTAGKPLVATEGTLMARNVIRDGTGWVTKDRDAESLVKTLMRASGELDEVAKRSRELMSHYGPMFHPDTFVSGLIALAGEAR